MVSGQALTTRDSGDGGPVEEAESGAISASPQPARPTGIKRFKTEKGLFGCD